MSAITLGFTSLAVWLLMWGEVSAGNIVSGVVVAALLMVVFPNDGPFWPRHLFHPIHALRFAGYFLVSIVGSNLTLSREILTPHTRIQTGVVIVPLPDCSPALVTFIANVIALTPGTMTVRTSNDPPEISVHVLQLYDIEEARASIDKLRYLAVRAFGAPEVRSSCVRLIEPGDPGVAP